MVADVPLADAHRRVVELLEAFGDGDLFRI